MFQPNRMSQAYENTNQDEFYLSELLPDEGPSVQIATEQSYSRALTTPDYPNTSRFIPSPNFTHPAEPRSIDLIVIHITDGAPNINGTINWFQNPATKVSSHYIVGQDGEVVQMVKDADIAWHARGANSHSLGIEHVANTKGLVPTDIQYCESAALVNWLANQYGIPMDRQHILGHIEAAPTAHKTCPGSDWNWDYFISMVTSGQCYPMPKAQSYQLSQPHNNMPRAQAAPALVVVGMIGGAVIERLVGSTDGDIKWEVDRLNGLKYPKNDKNQAGTGSYQSKQLKVNGLWVENTYTDRITADFEIDWQSNGRTLGNIDIRNVGTNDAVGWGLTVTGHIVDDANVYQRDNGQTFAAIDIIFTYRFDRTIGSDIIGEIRYKLYGDGTHSRSTRWTQR